MSRSRWAVLPAMASFALLVLSPVVPPAAAATDAAAETEFACLANTARADAGRTGLRIAADLVRVARAHSVRMADANRLHHNPNLTTDVTGWTALAENVGRGGSVASLHSAFMNSSGHRQNLLDARFTEVGIGVERRGTTVWVTQVFRRPVSTSAAPFPACQSQATVTPPTVTPPREGIRLSGDWNGDGVSTPAVFSDGRWYLSNSQAPGASITFAYGRSGDFPVAGDWNGDGRDTVGVIRDGTWHLRNSLAGGDAHVSFSYGRVSRGDLPIVGDWNGNGRDTPGIIRDGEWHLRNTLSGGPGQVVFNYGRTSSGDAPIVGDWNRNGIDHPGVVRSSEWHLRNSLSGGPAHASFAF
jgi:hypothetical protein